MVSDLIMPFCGKKQMPATFAFFNEYCTALKNVLTYFFAFNESSIKYKLYRPKPEKIIRRPILSP